MHSFESLKDFVFQFPGICKDYLKILLNVASKITYSGHSHHD